MTSGKRVAVVGGGWAGLAAAVEATKRGHHVTLFEMAPQLGGRSRGVDVAGLALDNGQHILIGAYVETLALMRTIGVDLGEAFVRTPLRVTYPDGIGLQLRGGSPMLAFGGAVLRQRGWRVGERIALLMAATGWVASGFRCEPSLTVAQLTQRLPRAIRDDLIDPLCVAALNTPAADASASVFLRVLKDALFSGPGSADLLLPRVSLSALLPTPAQRWLSDAGATLRLPHRVEALMADGERWSLDGERFDHVVLATTPVEAARLTREIAPEWSRTAAALRYEPIVTVYLHAAGARLAEPMLALRSDERSPAQFVFDRGQLGGPAGLLAFVVSGAQPWVDRGMDATAIATIAQAQAALGLPLTLVQTLTEKRATFRCTPGLQRPAMRIAPNLHAAGDHVIGPYPATLEGAVRSGRAAVTAFA
ncbi:MAG: hydroxysqualene dehydroxylase HpnE [Burkholderiales bacterium]